MGLFNIGRNKDMKAASVKKAENCDLTNIKSVKVLGLGCASCHKLYENVKTASAELGLDADVQYVTDMKDIASYGVMQMPVIVINEKVASVGKVLKTEAVKTLIIKTGE